MNRRDSLKALGLTTLSTGLLVAACKTDDKKADDSAAGAKFDEQGKQPFEIERDKKLLADSFFTDHEMATITVLADIIIPKDDRSGSASDAGVPAFIGFIVKDMPDHQTPMRGGLKWLDLKCLNLYGKSFVDCSHNQQIEMVTAIAYPAKATLEMQPGVTFFNRMRDLTATGFFSSKMGMKDIGYMGNSPMPGVFPGPPKEVLHQYGFSEKDLNLSLKG
ncbi:gluconate 2-dehydrogenase subunit 3 family protein [Mucilaginibacter ginkgonis]|uniref:Gluconate 2-dehydrogenase subunit 3 family protein n=1 Tax=Mucilaginibacter ginkgonis TaxID=2682091 RepID=A0A6I4I2S2_9SPHI|nr:gluconate 2-dehydrogenase subunit 3 family protein [Mucilaginibacter ginkgonis]QQL49084.1 gluconate 2-dehydrogenase subunit 3 family protein [Mucilaginibacter ginkgonis]